MLIVCFQCTFMEYKDHKIVYRRYASLYFVAGVDVDEVINMHAHLIQAYSGAVNRLKSPKIAQNRGLKLSNFS